jgi:DNA polymerase alpha subunit B
VVVGRIVGESDSKLQESSIMLESSRMLGSGVRIPLRFEPNFTIQGGLPYINLWPGMIFAARGKNGGGGWFSVTDFIEVTEHSEFNKLVLIPLASHPAP